MGCVSSKQSKQHARLEAKWGKTSPGRRKPFDNSSQNELSFEDYHRHLVALTSSSYGLLKLDTPKPPEEVRRSTARVRSLDDFYDRLDVRESMESVPNSCNGSGVLQTMKPGPQRSISMPVLHTNKPAVQETINVSDIMQGLEEGVSSSSSPSEDVGSMEPSVHKLQPFPSPPSPPEKVSTRRHRILDKMASFPHINEGFAGHEKLLRSENSNKVLAHAATHLQGKSEEHLPLIMQKRRNRAHQGQHVSTKTLSIPNESKETPMENRSLLSSKLPSGVPYSASSTRLKLTLNLEYEGTVIAGMHMGHDVCNSAGSSARRSIVDALTEPDSPLFDPALLASYEKALKELRKEDWSIADDTSDFFEKMRLTKETEMDIDAEPSENYESDLDKSSSEATVVPSLKIQSFDPLSGFEWRCPPGGEEAVVLYTTTLHGIRKTFEDCNSVRDILKGFNVGFHERDVSMHATYRNELKELLGGQVSVPSMFIKGRYIGGVDDAVRLHEEGKLSALLKGLPKDLNNEICDGCGDMHFVPCLACSGSCKVVDQDKSVSRCPECNENGLIPCPICT